MIAIARRLLGHVQELPGIDDHPFIVWAFTLCGYGLEVHDEVPWCSVGLNVCALLAGKERTNHAAARSWLLVGDPIKARLAQPGDVVILSRGVGPQPGPDIIKAPGHVTVFDGWAGADFNGIGGNQHNAWTLETFPLSRVLGVRRLRTVEDS